MTFAEGDNVPEALVLDRPNKRLGVGVQVRAPRRQPQQLYARALEQGPEVRRIEGISIHDQVPEARQRARRGVGEVAGDLRHPSPVGLGSDAGDVNGAGLEVDDEQHEVACEAPAREHRHDESLRGHQPAHQGGRPPPMRSATGLGGPEGTRAGVEKRRDDARLAGVPLDRVAPPCCQAEMSVRRLPCASVFRVTRLVKVPMNARRSARPSGGRGSWQRRR